MNIVDERPAEQQVGGRSTRREALDASIERELRRGELAGANLDARRWDVLDALVQSELRSAEPTTEDSLFAATPIFGILRGPRFRRRLGWLLNAGLIRRDRMWLRPTVAGIAAVRPFSSLPGSQRPPQDVLRALRRGEIGTI